MAPYKYNIITGADAYFSLKRVFQSQVSATRCLTQVNDEPPARADLSNQMCSMSVINGGGGYVFRPLTAEQVDIAYPLVRELFHSLTMEQWRYYARQLIAKKRRAASQRGINAAERPERYLRGLFTHHVMPDVEQGKRLMIDCVVVPDAVDRTVLTESLLRAIEQLADQHRCKVVQVQLGAHNYWMASILVSAGCACQTPYSLR